MDDAAVTAGELRARIRAGTWTGPTAGCAPGFEHANVVILPAAQAPAPLVPGDVVTIESPGGGGHGRP